MEFISELGILNSIWTRKKTWALTIIFLQRFGQSIKYDITLTKLSTLAKSEIGFLKVIVRPLYVHVSKFLNGGVELCI
jgi:hypothetical protein